MNGLELFIKGEVNTFRDLVVIVQTFLNYYWIILPNNSYVTDVISIKLLDSQDMAYNQTSLRPPKTSKSLSHFEVPQFTDEQEKKAIRKLQGIN